MNSTKGSARARLMTTTLLAGLAAIAAPLAIGTVATVVPTIASAQDYTSGTLTGTVRDGSGAPVTGAKVTIKSLAQGFSRDLTTDETGQFRVPLIPGGGYSVAISKQGYQSTNDGNVQVTVGGTSAYSFTLPAAGETVAEVVITATANPQLDFSQSTKGLTLDVETLQKQVPLPRNITGVALLAPGVVKAVSGFSNTDGSAVPTIGGSSAGENAFYINGLNITNFDTYVGGATVPFDFYKSVDVKTGGLPAEYGRATGGVLNAVTKSGTNEFKFAVHGNFQLSDLQDHSPDTYATKNSRASSDRKEYIVEAGGPIIKDRLFAYGLYQVNDIQSTGAGITSKAYREDRSASPFYGFKLDGYLTDKQHFEYTQFNTTQITSRRNYAYDPTTDTIGAVADGTKFKSGGNNWIAKYTGSFTDWFTLSAAYGHSRDEDYTLPGSTGFSYVSDARANGTAIAFGPTPVANQSTNIDNTTRKFYRVDGDFYFDVFGKHHVRTGYDHESTDLFHSSLQSGGLSYNYGRVRSQNTSNALGLPLNQQYVRVRVSNFGGAQVTGANESFYIQDSWDVTDRVNLQIGARDDIFKLNNLKGQQVLNLKDNWAGRFAISYDVFGDGHTKAFASYGRYFIPPASNLSFRGADLYYFAYFLPPDGGLSYDAFIDPITKKPTALGTQIDNPKFNAANGTTICPAGPVGSTSSHGCIVYGNGIQEPAGSKAAVGLKASYEDEFIVGFEHKFNPLWKASATLTYRNLGRTAEDMAVDSAIVKWCARNPTVNGCSAPDLTDVLYGDADYVVATPGRDTTIIVRTDLATPLAGKKINLTAADIGNPKAVREYTALELSFSRAWDGKWMLNGSYTLSRLYGNYEGTVKSDAGNSAQVDAGSTQEFDHPGLEEYATGLLPNHRGHQFKLYGAYAITENLQIGGNATVNSPRHYGCIGYYGRDQNDPNYDPYASGYGAASRWCYNGTTSVPVPRGSAFKGDWYSNLDLQVRYTVPSMGFIPGGLTLRADVFNVFNQKNVTQNYEVGDSSASSVDVNYKKPIEYQTPRYVRLGFDWAF
jgi:hypothetical protein